MPSPTIPVATSTSSLLFDSVLTQASSNAFSILFGLGTCMNGMSSVGLFSSTPMVVNPSTQSGSFATTFHGFPWNASQIPPLVPTFGIRSAHNLGSVSGFNLVLGP